MPKRATISDVAQHAGVSIATVSRVVNQTAPVTPEIAERVQTAIAELNYKPHTAARSLATRKTNTLGLLLPEISGDFFSPMMRGIEGVVRDAAYDLLISTHSSRGAGQHPLGEHNTDGLLVFTDSLAEPELAHLHRLGFPVVLLYQSAPGGLAIPCVTFENKDGARKLVDHLIETHNYRRIGFLAGPAGNEDSHWRELGYRQALAAHGMAFDPALVATGGFDYRQALDAVTGWLAAGSPLDAIFAGDDESATGALEALRRAGKRVPDDVPVVGFDDVPLSRHLNPPLTTVRAPIEETGRAAARQLISLIRTGRAESLVLLPTELVIRQSCGCQ